MSVYLAAIRTDDGIEVQSVCGSREQARLACHESHWEIFALDVDACAKLAEVHGIVVDENGEGPDAIMACDILPDVWQR